MSSGHSAVARNVIAIERASLAMLEERLNTASFDELVDVILAMQGKCIICGMGKSGHVARKIAATLASTGTPAIFLHPAEAGHGDLGVIMKGDVVLAISHSGESDEISENIVVPIKRMGLPLVVWSANPDSYLAKIADIYLSIHAETEACPHNLAPTSSTTNTMALGDALAISLLTARDFRPDDFARTHPAGALGRRLLLRVADVMRQGDAIPAIADDLALTQVVVEISRYKMGMALLIADERLVGIITDGDIRRWIERHNRIDEGTVARDISSATPITIEPERLAYESLQLMESRRINHLAVVRDDGALVGALSLHDLLINKVI